jgi:hypothetical protein
MKTFLTPSTGKIVDYPDHFAELKPYLIEVTSDVPCADCVVKNPGVPLATESVDIKEPAVRTPRVKKGAA